MNYKLERTVSDLGDWEISALLDSVDRVKYVTSILTKSLFGGYCSFQSS